MAAAVARLGMTTLLVGSGRKWSATYGVWTDELSDLTALGIDDPGSMAATTSDDVVVVTDRVQQLDRVYATLDNERLRERLRQQTTALSAEVTGLSEHVDRVELSTTIGAIAARRVVLATGTGAPAPFGVGRSVDGAWQTAYGVILDTVPASDRFWPGRTVLMDLSGAYRAGGDELGVPSFCYVVRTAQGWLVEETVLTASPSVEPRALRNRLIARLGDPELVEHAERDGAVEEVRIAMNTAALRPTPRVVPFGAAAAMVHPATGYSVAAALRRAPVLAAALAGQGSPAEAVWPRSMRATRLLHRYGAAVLGQLDAASLRGFFDVFFDRPVSDWATYLQIDASPVRVARVMAAVFRDAPASVRYRLASAGWVGHGRR